VGRVNISGAVTATYDRRGDAEGRANWGGCSMGRGARRAKYRRRWDLEQFGLSVGV
jgi:hypothetical protein